MQPGAILQPLIPAHQLALARARLPQMQPIPPADWLRIDAAYAAQLAEKARLIAAHRDRVIGELPGAEAAASELLDAVLQHLGPREGPGPVPQDCRADGIPVPIDRADPLLSLSRLVAEDLCILERQGDQHVLTAAVLCFPAAWTLAEKLGRPLTGIHGPVPAYHPVAQRVQRLFDMVRWEQPLARANLHRYDRPDLFQPHVEAAPRPVGTVASPYLRSEWQVIRRLPRTGAVVFSIHTTMVAVSGEG